MDREHTERTTETDEGTTTERTDRVSDDSGSVEQTQTVEEPAPPDNPDA